jgi:hypothetical protein
MYRKEARRFAIAHELPDRRPIMPATLYRPAAFSAMAPRRSDAILTEEPAALFWLLVFTLRHFCGSGTPNTVPTQHNVLI